MMLSSALARLRADNGAIFRCGHPRTVENTQSVGIGNGVRCRICRRKIVNRSFQKKSADV